MNKLPMFAHNLTKYTEGGVLYAESWLQLTLFKKCFCFWKKKIAIIPR